MEFHQDTRLYFCMMGLQVALQLHSLQDKLSSIIARKNRKGIYLVDIHNIKDEMSKVIASLMPISELLPDLYKDLLNMTILIDDGLYSQALTNLTNDLHSLESKETLFDARAIGELLIQSTEVPASI